jgi:hypothetical protein
MNRGYLERLSTLLSFMLTAQIVLAVAWTALNFNHVPRYGDTPEYIDLAKTLRTDAYRGVLYPLMIYLAQRMGPASHFHWYIYILQLAMSLGASLYFFHILLSCLGSRAGGQEKITSARRRALRLFCALLVSTNPLVLHFSLTVLTDSLALSFALLFVASLSALLLGISPGALHASVLLASFIGMSLMRAEKYHVGVGVLVASGLAYGMIRRRSDLRGFLRRLSVPLAVLVVSTWAVFHVRETQTADLGRPPARAAVFAFNRCVWPNLAEMYPRLPARIKEIVTYEDALFFDKHKHHVNFLMSKIQRATGDWDETESMLKEMTKLCLRDHPARAAFSIGRDFLKYVFSPFVVVYESFDGSGIMKWTYSRMSMFHPRLTWVFTRYSFILLIIQLPLLLVAVTRLAQKDPASPRRAGLILFSVPSVLFLLVNSAFFSCVSTLGMHNRYALPGYTLMIGFTHFAVLLEALSWRVELREAEGSGA